MRVAELWRYPVKSMAGERVDRASVDRLGIPGDRAFAVRQNGVTRNAKKFPQLMSLRACYETEPSKDRTPAPVIALEDGTRFSADDPVADEHIRRIVGEDACLAPLAPETDLDFYRRRERRTPEEQRAILGLENDEPFPDTSKFPARVAEFATPPGTFFDCYPLLVMTTASLDALQQALPDSMIDVRRFRPNILIECEEAGFLENAWAGRSLRIGTAVLSLEVPCPRCAMTTVGFHELPRDTQIMRALVRSCRHELGIYAECRRAGEIRVGDEVELS